MFLQEKQARLRKVGGIGESPRLKVSYGIWAGECLGHGLCLGHEEHGLVRMGGHLHSRSLDRRMVAFTGSTLLGVSYEPPGLTCTPGLGGSSRGASWNLRPQSSAGAAYTPPLRILSGPSRKRTYADEVRK